MSGCNNSYPSLHSNEGKCSDPSWQQVSALVLSYLLDDWRDISELNSILDSICLLRTHRCCLHDKRYRYSGQKSSFLKGQFLGSPSTWNQQMCWAGEFFPVDTIIQTSGWLVEPWPWSPKAQLYSPGCDDEKWPQTLLSVLPWEGGVQNTLVMSNWFKSVEMMVLKTDNRPKQDLGVGISALSYQNT